MIPAETMAGVVAESDARLAALRDEVARLLAKNAALAQELRETDEALGDYTVNIIRSLPEAAAKLRARVAELEAERDAEREACAQICEAVGGKKEGHSIGYRSAAWECAALIRGRGANRA